MKRAGDNAANPFLFTAMEKTGRLYC